jgi:mono/diheme cytochrome c family protein
MEDPAMQAKPADSRFPTTPRSRLCLGLLLVGVLVPLAASADETGADLVLADLGAPLFARHCASCHGAGGRGDGPVAAVLKPPPADLTAIALRRGGVFPRGEIARFIDGRFDLTAHGSRDMPVWGARFGADIPESGVGESISRGSIATLVEYLKSIQDPPFAPSPPRDP